MKTKDMCLCALFAVLIAVGAFIKLPISIVPITMQTLFVMLAGLFLKEKAVYSVLLYVGIGLLGFPVFTSGGGLSYVLVPTFGYLVGFIVCSYYLGHIKSDNFYKTLIHCLIGVLIIYIIGILYFVFIQYVYYQQVFAFSWLLTSLFLVFLPGDILSCIVAIIIHRRLKAYVS
ncbi:MAG: biotin transporter BioY [Coprobacillus sp.]